MNATQAEAPAPRLSVVVPCYNEAEGLRELHRRVTLACRAVLACRAEVESSYELVLVNDGSTDGTWTVIRELAEEDPNVVGVSLSRNHGHQLALTSGLSLCRGERVLILDADLQDPPELLGRMMDLMDKGADVVYGKRIRREGETWFKKATAAAFYRALGRLVEFPIPVDTGDFRLMSRRAVDVLNAMPERHRFIRGMVSWIGLTQVPLHYLRQGRYAGSTKYPLAKMVRFAVDAISSFSIAPLRLASYLGLLFGVGGLLALAYVLYSWLTHQTVPGWTSVITVVLILGSAQLFLLGIFGEYLGRLYLESKRRPLFVIDQIVRRPATAANQTAAPSLRSDNPNLTAERP
ncbi:MAG TPA: glycosyltransferase family 2 protein, partial [Trebonia sp.]